MSNEKSIRLKSHEVRAILDGNKTQTRRVMKNQPAGQVLGDVYVRNVGDGFQWFGIAGESSVFKCPFGALGMMLWVRETWAIASKSIDLVKIYYKASERKSHTEFHKYFPIANADGMSETWPKYRPSNYMPRWASRITL